MEGQEERTDGKGIVPSTGKPGSSSFPFSFSFSFSLSGSSCMFLAFVPTNTIRRIGSQPAKMDKAIFYPPPLLFSNIERSLEMLDACLADCVSDAAFGVVVVVVVAAGGTGFGLTGTATAACGLASTFAVGGAVVSAGD